MRAGEIKAVDLGFPLVDVLVSVVPILHVGVLLPPFAVFERRIAPALVHEPARIRSRAGVVFSVLPPFAPYVSIYESLVESLPVGAVARHVLVPGKRIDVVLAQLFRVLVKFYYVAGVGPAFRNKRPVKA